MFENEKFEEILRYLRRGDVILYPTDTVWGIGCDATNAEAVERVYTIKERSSEKGLIILVSSIDMLHAHVAYVPPKVETLLAYHERPLTVVYEKGKDLAPNLLAPDGSVAIRLVKDAFCRELIEQLGKPLVSTSANISSQPFPKFFGEISSDIFERVDFVVKYKQDDRTINEPSVIARLGDDEELEFIRE
jgi:L-threonylcarbamoyladenylate synthase